MGAFDGGGGAQWLLRLTTMRWRRGVGVSTKPVAARPAAKVRFAVDVEEVRARTQSTKRDQQAPIEIEWDQGAPIKMVSGRAWSLGIYDLLGSEILK